MLASRKSYTATVRLKEPAATMSPMTGVAMHEMMPACAPADVFVRMVVWSRPGRARCQLTMEAFRPAMSLHGALCFEPVASSAWAARTACRK